MKRVKKLVKNFKRLAPDMIQLFKLISYDVFTRVSQFRLSWNSWILHSYQLKSSNTGFILTFVKFVIYSLFC